MKIIKPKSLPTPLTLMMLVIIVAAISTWLLPAGQYSKLSADNYKTFVISSTSDTLMLPFTQHTLDSLSIKISLQKFLNGDIRKPISVPDTYQKLKSRSQGIVSVLQAPVKGIADSIDIVLFILFIGGFMPALGPLMTQELEGIKNVWNVPMAGMFSNAELGRATGGNLEMHNLTPV